MAGFLISLPIRGWPQSEREVFSFALWLTGFTLLALGFSGALTESPAIFLTSGTVVLISAALLVLRHWFKAAMRRQAMTGVKLLFKDEICATFLSDNQGVVTWANRIGLALLPDRATKGTTLATVLKAEFPTALTAIRRLAEQVNETGQGQQIITCGNAQITLSANAFQGHILWRLRQPPDPPDKIEAKSAILTVGRNGTIFFMNSAAKALVGERVVSIDKLVTNMPDDYDIAQIRTKEGLKPVKVLREEIGQGRWHWTLLPRTVGEDEIQIALNNLPVPMLEISQEGRIKTANQLALSLLGRNTLAGVPLREVFDSVSGEPVDATFGPGLQRKGIETDLMRVRNVEQETFVKLSLKQLRGGDAPSLIAVLTDATELKSLEAKFVQSQKMQAIGQLAGGVAHDFNNLLTAISGHCDLMLLRHDPGDQDYADLMQVHQNANRAAALVSQLLAFSRKQTLRLETLDLRNTLSDLTHLLNRLVGEKVTLSLAHDPVLKAIKADKRQLEQVVMNLVVNARDAMPQGGVISIETEALQLATPLTRDRVTVPVGDYVVVRVRDQGSGISPEGMQKIFEPFYTTKRTGEGTGLGLSTAYGIVKQTGGYIFADSEIGQGTSFSLLFPACEHSDKIPLDPVGQLDPGGLERCEGVVLLVEDEAPVRAFASRALSMRGFDVLEAASAEQALELLKDTTLQVDVFVTDVVMPGMDGPTWVRKALTDRPNTRTVFVSGYAEGAFKGDQPKVPNSVFLPKPFSLTELTSTVQNQLC